MSRKAFTLVELLVVISIIALLLSVMMPSLQKARESAKTVICSSRLKQWGLAFQMYESDNEGWLSSPFGSDSVPLWISQVAIGSYLPNEAYVGASGSEILSGGIAVCPSHKEASKSIYKGRSYSFNYNIRTPDEMSNTFGYFLWKNIDKKSKRLVLADGCWDRPGWATGGLKRADGLVSFFIRSWTDLNYYRHSGRGGEDGVETRYSGKCNVLFGDWHVGKFEYQGEQSSKCMVYKEIGN